MKLFATLLFLLFSAVVSDAETVRAGEPLLRQAPGTTNQHPEGRPESRKPHARAMGESDFAVLCERVKHKSFTDDKLEMVEVGALGTGFTSAQCLRILSLFSFDDDRMKALRLMAPRLVDPGNAEAIIESFTFDSGRREAAKIILGSMKDRPQGR